MIYAYSGISSKKLDEQHTTKNGKTYTLRHNDKLVSSTNYKGKNASGTNANGWERNSHKFFSDLQQQHPEMFSRANTARIKAKQNPRVDNTMIKHAPELKDFKGEKLVHHHIGENGQAVAAPSSVHPGYGEIHNAEKAAGITEKCKNFSDECEKMAKKNPDMVGKPVNEFHAQMQKQSASQKQPAAQKNTAQQSTTQKASAQSVSRSQAARSTNSKSAVPGGQSRAGAVRTQSGASRTGSTGGQSRSGAARSASSGGKSSGSAGQSAGHSAGHSSGQSAGRGNGQK